jgi:hypothetical protein
MLASPIPALLVLLVLRLVDSLVALAPQVELLVDLLVVQLQAVPVHQLLRAVRIQVIRAALLALLDPLPLPVRQLVLLQAVLQLAAVLAAAECLAILPSQPVSRRLA